MARVVHPIEQESYGILRARVDTSPLPPLTRAVVERVIHSSADLDYLDDLVCDEAVLAQRAPRCAPARRSSPTWRWSPRASPPATASAGSATAGRGAARADRPHPRGGRIRLAWRRSAPARCG